MLQYVHAAVLRRFGAVTIVGAASVLSQPAHGENFVNSFGLKDFDSIVTFDEQVFEPGTWITNQFIEQGVYFEPGLFYDTQLGDEFPGLDGHHLGSNIFGEVNPFSIKFNQVQSAAAFGLVTTLTTTFFTAKLRGEEVESFFTLTDYDNPDRAFYGFQNILFDEIVIDVAGNPTSALIDNIQLKSIPAPSMLAMLGVGGIVAGRSRRWRK